MVPTSTPTDAPVNGPALVPTSTPTDEHTNGPAVVPTPTPSVHPDIDEAKAGALAMLATARKGGPVEINEDGVPAQVSPHHVRIPAAIPSPSENFVFNETTVLAKLQANLQVIAAARKLGATYICAFRAGHWLVVGGWKAGTDVQSSSHDADAFWYTFDNGQFTLTVPPQTTSPELFRERYQCLF
jgi:hypothetical protein